MARFCSKCNKKFGFFEEEYNGMCKNCYEVSIEEERIKLQKEKEEKIRKQEQEKQERIKKKEEERKAKEEKNKIELKQKEKYITKIISKYNNFIIATANTIEVASGILKECLGEGKQIVYYILSQNSENIYTKLKYETLDWNIIILEYIISLLPLQAEYEDVEKICTLENFKNFVYKFNDIFNIKKETIAKYNNFNSAIYKENILANDFIDIEKSFSKLNQNLDDSIHSSNMELNFEFSTYCKDTKKLNALSYTYLLYVSLLYELLVFDKNILIFKDNKELNKIFFNLVKSKSDKEYISNKLYELCSSLYKDEFIGTQSKKMFDIITTILLKMEVSNILDNNIKRCYEILDTKEKNIKYEQLPEDVDEKLFENIEIHFLKSIATEIEFKEFIKQIAFLFEISKSDYKLLKDEVKKINAQKERDRILNGDFSKEIEMQKQEIEYSNVQNGYEFEEYVANLYKKLGYTIEEVTKKSGDQGADVIAYKDNKKYVIQAKFYNNPVGNKAVQEVVGAIGMYKADRGIVVTNNAFTSSAIELAQANNVELVDGEKIEELKKIIIENI